MNRPIREPSLEAALAQAARDALASPSAREVTVLRVAVPAPEVQPLAWLAAQTEQKRGYWADRDGTCEVALVGEADEIKGMAAQDVGSWERAVALRLNQAVGDIRYYGGFRFGPWHPTDHAWQPFGAYRFILPRFEVMRTRTAGTVLAMNLVRDAAGRWPAVENLQLESCPAEYTPPALPTLLGRRDEPDAAAWAVGVRSALELIRHGRMEKIVLARRALLALSGMADPLALLHGLQRQTGRCFQFCGSHGAGFSFVGASPELLYRRSGRHLDSEAVAGTRPRGATEAEDLALADDLLRHPKEAEEHRLVRDRIVHDLADLSEQVGSDSGPSLLKLGRVQHLRTAIQATLKHGITDADVLSRLHPTPATAGEPVAAALAALSGLEPFDRGWYAGPVGWVGRDAAEFAVALRCGLVVKSNLLLYAGAGIVPGSDAESEAREIESKLAPFLRLFAP